MPAPFLQTFLINGTPHTSVVLDRSDFNDLCDTIGEVELQGKRLSKEQLAYFKEIEHIPMIGHGTKTAHIFERYAVQTPTMSAIVRGAGPRVAQKLLEAHGRLP